MDPLKIAILGGGEEELNILSELHRSSRIDLVGVYDTNPKAVALEIAEIIGIPRFSDNSFIDAFRKADYTVISGNRSAYEEEIRLLKQHGIKIINPAEAAGFLSNKSIRQVEREDGSRCFENLDEALKYIYRINDRERLLKWMIRLSIDTVKASSGSLMLYSNKTAELFIGYAFGLSKEVIESTRQKLGEGIAGSVARTGKAKLINKILETPLYQDGRERESIKSAISAPLIHQNKLIGVLNISTNEGEKTLTGSDLELIEKIASRVSPILEQHLRIDFGEVRELESEIRYRLDSMLQKDIGFHRKFSSLCTLLADKLSADSVTIYTATDAGDWLILGGSDGGVNIEDAGLRIHCTRGSLARAFLDGEEIILSEVLYDRELKRVKKDSDAITSIFIPLVHEEKAGVVEIEFSNLEALQLFLRAKDSICFQISVFTYLHLKGLKQQRKFKTLEEMSTLVPSLLGRKGLNSRLDDISRRISSMVGANRASLHYSGEKMGKTIYHNFPDQESERESQIKYDNEILQYVLEDKEPFCLGFVPLEEGISRESPSHRSVLAFPLIITSKLICTYIGYEKKPLNPLEATVFGGYEIDLLRKISDLLRPVLKEEKTVGEEEELPRFDELIKSNQRMFIDQIWEEINRAQRYHHGFTVTLFKIVGLRDLFEKDHNRALILINEISLAVREHVRKTDYFSWIETDLFAVLSIESYQRMGYLEKRICNLIEKILKTENLYRESSFYPTSGYALFPGTSESPVELINQARSRLNS